MLLSSAARSRVARKEKGTLLHRTGRCLVLLVIATGFTILGAGLALAQNAPAHPESAPPTNGVRLQEGGNPGPSPAASKEEEEHGLPQKAVEIARPFGFPITNSMIVSWIV